MPCFAKSLPSPVGPLLLLFLLAGTPSPLSAGAEAPSSAIPDRREFPLSKTVKPCDNFYEYACSEAISRFKLRDDRSSHTFAFSDSYERLLSRKQDFLKDIDKKRRAGEKLSDRSNTLATVYGACMDPEARKKEELETVKQLLADLAAIETHEEFQAFLVRQGDKGRPSFITVDSISNLDESDRRDFAFFAHMMTLPERSYYLKADVRQDYEKLLAAFFRTIGEAKPEAQAKAVLKLETEFAKIDPLPAEMREIFMRKTSISKEQVRNQYPSFRLDSYLNRVPEKTVIRHFVPKSYAFADKQLRGAKLEDLKALYAHFALESVLDDAYPDYFKASFAFQEKHLGGPSERPSREERCTMRVMYDYAKEIDAELLPQVFPDFPEEKFIALAERVRAAIIDGVRTNEWLSDSGRIGAIEKISKAKLQLVKPRNDEEWHFNPPASYDAKTPIANEAALKAALQKRMFDELPKKRNRDRWEMGPLEINAYYSPDDNKFVMPIGILQYPFYDPNLSEEANLGAVGTVIGHELGHAIDDQGARMDADGKLRQWMSDKDVKTFQGRGKKLVAQFNKAGHDGQLTLGENIGDLTGLTFAYRAAFPKGEGSVDKKRDFFLQYARVWCGVERPKFAEQMLKIDPHARGWARVNEQLKHQADFAKVYSCKKGDRMVLDPKDILRIW